MKKCKTTMDSHSSSEHHHHRCPHNHHQAHLKPNTSIAFLQCISSQCKLIKKSFHQKVVKSTTSAIEIGHRLRAQVWLLPTAILLQLFLLLSQSNASAAVNILCSDPVHYGTLELLIKQAEIPNGVCDLESECDLFVRIFVDGALIGQSRVSPNSNRPAFNEYFKIESVTNISTLRLVVMDDDRQDSLTEPPDEPDEIFEIFLRIDEDILAEGRNGKQMEVDGYSLKGIGAMGK